MVQAAKVSVSDGSDEANISLRSADSEHFAHGDSDAEHRSPQIRSDMQSSDMPEVGHSMPPPVWSPAGVQDMLMPHLNKGSISNLATFSVMLLGMLLSAATRGDPADCALPETFGQAVARWVLAAGLFGFAGGITNWLAIKMLFDRVCNLPVRLGLGLGLGFGLGSPGAPWGPPIMIGVPGAPARQGRL